MTEIVVADLDRTLIFSPSAVGPAGTAGLVTVESRHGRPASFVTPAAARWLATLGAHEGFVLVTSRSEAQVRRIDLPGGLPRRVLCANGARLIVDGELHRGHSATWAARLASFPSGDELAAGARALVGALDDSVSITPVDQTFAVARFDDAARARRVEAVMRTWAAIVGAEVGISGRKAYVLPRPLSKASAVRMLTDGAAAVAAAGDSALDASMLAEAAEALVPAGSEVAAAGAAPTTLSSGAAAGEEIAVWLGGKLGAVPGG